MHRLLFRMFIQQTIFLMFFVIYPIALMATFNIYMCRETFIYFENYCYYFARETQIFTIAEENCNNFSLSQSNPCHLTSIHSAREDAFVRANAQRLWGKNSFWLGATIRKDSIQNDDVYAQFSWLDGSSMNFVNFKHKQNPGIGPCLQWKYPGWNGAKCSLFKKYFVCKTMAPCIPPKLSLSFNNVILANKTYIKNGEYDEDNENGTYVEEGKEINVTCLAEGAKPFANLTWTLNGETHDVEFTRSTNEKENRTFDSQSTLRFVANGTNITVTCNSSLQGTEIQTLISVTFLTYVKPKLYLEVNGIEASSKTYVKEFAEVNITCHAIGARPVPQINWMKYQTNYSQLQESKTVNATFDVTSTLMLNASKNEEEFVCRTTIYEVNITDEITLILASYVLPEPILTVDDNSSEVIYIEQEEKVTITCDASGAKPQAELSWMLNGHPVDKTNFKSFSGPSNVFSILKLQPRQNDTVKCTIFIPGPNKTKVDSVTFYVKVRNEEQSGDGRFDNLIIWVVLSLVATFMTVLVCCVGSATRRAKASKSSDLPASLQLTGTTNDRQVNGVSMTSRELPAIRQSMLLISPEIDNEEIYCDVEDKAEEVANVEMIVQLPGEGMFQYWTANATFNKDVRTKIIAKCVSDSVQMKDHLKFKTLAESVATLNKHRNIIDILGVSTANVPYYIYTEYLEYGTLRDFLMRNYQQSRDSQCTISQTLDERAIHLTGFALDVLDGLMYLTDRDYRHPALCTRKVLLNKTCTCKLYDFWPKSLSTDRMHQILQKPLPPVAWLPPETIFLRHYSDKSDVWTFGIVTWEIYSLGEIPYSGLTCEEIEQEIRKMRNLDQPLTCPGGIYSMMLASWDTSVDERPALSEWKQKLVCLLQSAKQDSEDGDTGGSGDRSYFTLENNASEYEDGYIEQ